MVTDNTLRSGIWSAVYGVLSSTALVGSTTIPVYGSYPDENPSFPMLVIENPTVAKSDFTYDRTYSRKSIVVNVDLYTKRSDQIDLIGDKIDSVMSSTSIAGVQLQGIDESLAVSPSNDNKIHLKTFSLNYFRG